MEEECEDCGGKGQVFAGRCGDGCCYYYDTCETCWGSGTKLKEEE
jgi:DnaJ-class molecular chaperone